MKQSKSEFWSGEEYDAQYGNSYTGEISFFQDLIFHQKVLSLLDVCCGTGLVTIPLSRKLSHVVGIDFSSSMIDFAKYKSSSISGIAFYEMDAADFNLQTVFDLIVMTGNAFQAFISDEDFSSMLNNINSHMHAKSLFVFDSRLPCSEHFETTSSYEHWSSYKSPAGENVSVSGLDSRHPKLNNTMLHHVRREYENGEQYHSSIELKYRSIEEIVKGLERNGLQLVEYYADWKKTPLTETSTSFVGVVRPL
ncbi:class I SAM-dependent DNA methyltransferase [Vibrio parahaemolyticus]|uniref:class I SAM-dependent DNA methyltransferase n=1 Tax=Vibrio parahaemolyticus TaxID=670 RepID=UPI001F4EDEDD|nr:class I SAM-dependent methyltransferase [Vibrio parahaemolyticus]HCG8613269.1 class I SAM-dependent methyltransferase [Vibrio parahaemolyticus]